MEPIPSYTKEIRAISTPKSKVVFQPLHHDWPKLYEIMVFKIWLHFPWILFLNSMYIIFDIWYFFSVLQLFLFHRIIILVNHDGGAERTPLILVWKWPDLFCIWRYRLQILSVVTCKHKEHCGIISDGMSKSVAYLDYSLFVAVYVLYSNQGWFKYLMT